MLGLLAGKVEAELRWGLSAGHCDFRVLRRSPVEALLQGDELEIAIRERQSAIGIERLKRN